MTSRLLSQPVGTLTGGEIDTDNPRRHLDSSTCFRTTCSRSCGIALPRSPASWSLRTLVRTVTSTRSNVSLKDIPSRPPGHHSTPSLCGGYCYLSNAAIATRYLQSLHLPALRIAILDIDYHHGNGAILGPSGGWKAANELRRHVESLLRRQECSLCLATRLSRLPLCVSRSLSLLRADPGPRLHRCGKRARRW